MDTLKQIFLENLPELQNAIRSSVCLLACVASGYAGFYSAEVNYGNEKGHVVGHVFYVLASIIACVFTCSVLQFLQLVEEVGKEFLHGRLAKILVQIMVWLGNFGFSMVSIYFGVKYGQHPKSGVAAGHCTVGTLALILLALGNTQDYGLTDAFGAAALGALYIEKDSYHVVARAAVFYACRHLLIPLLVEWRPVVIANQEDSRDEENVVEAPKFIKTVASRFWPYSEISAEKWMNNPAVAPKNKRWNFLFSCC